MKKLAQSKKRARAPTPDTIARLERVITTAQAHRAAHLSEIAYLTHKVSLQQTVIEALQSVIDDAVLLTDYHSPHKKSP